MKQEEQDKTKNVASSPSPLSNIPNPSSSNEDVDTVATSDVETAASDSISLPARLETQVRAL